MDLFAPVVLKGQQHQNFRNITQPGFCVPELEVIRGWADGFLDRDGKFVREFQTTFNSSFWELYLHACFKELGCTVNFSHPTPDFFVDSPYGDFIAEATTANHPQGFRPEWDRDLQLPKETSMEELLRLSIIRLSNAIAAKHKKYISKYSKLPHVQNKPFVICVAPFEQPLFYLQDSLAIVQLLYAYGGALVRLGSQEGEVIVIGEAQKLQVQKSPGVYKLGLFTNPNMAEVSAVIFNNRATISKVRALAREGNYPVLFSGSRFVQSEHETGAQRFVTFRPDYRETVLDGLHILINPFAKNPLDLRMFDDREVAFHTFDSETNSYISEIPDGFLLQRICQSITSEDFSQEFKQSINEQSYQELIPEIWQEEQLIYVGGQSGSFRDNHMAHYRGWTIVVSLDSIDEDWGTQTVNSLRYNIAQFMQANRDKNIASIGIPEWFQTKEEAYEAIKHKIDQIVNRIN